MPLLSLPDAVLLSILDHLPSWTCLTVLPCVSKSMQSIVRQLTACQLDAKELVLFERELQASSSSSSSSLPTLTNITRILCSLENLHFLHLSGFRSIDDAALSALLSRHRDSLQELSVAGVTAETAALHLPSITHVSLRRCRRLTTLSFDCPHLQELDLSATLFGDFELPRFFSSGLLADTLRVLRLRGCKNICRLPLPSLPAVTILEVSYTGITDESLAQACEAAPNLRVLYAADCAGLVFPTVALPLVRTLNVRQCRRLKRLTLATPALRELDVSHSRIRDDNFTELLNTLPELRRLTLTECWEIEAPGKDADGGDALTASQLKLEHLDVSFTGQRGHSLRNIVAHAPHLRTLLARRCELVADDFDGVWHLPSVEVVHIGGCPPLSDDAITSLIQGAPRMHTLSVRGCRAMSGLCWRDHLLPSQCSALRKLDISWTSTTDDALAELLALFPNLTHLTCDATKLELPVVRSPSVRTLSLEYQQHLRAVSFEGCDNLRDLNLSSNMIISRLDGLETGCPSLQLLRYTASDRSVLRNALSKFTSPCRFRILWTKHSVPVEADEPSSPTTPPTEPVDWSQRPVTPPHNAGVRALDDDEEVNDAEQVERIVLEARLREILERLPSVEPEERDGLQRLYALLEGRLQRLARMS